MQKGEHFSTSLSWLEWSVAAKTDLKVLTYLQSSLSLHGINAKAKR